MGLVAQIDVHETLEPKIPQLKFFLLKDEF